MKIQERFYFDFNASAPLAKKVCEWLKSASCCYANPSALHGPGKNARKDINQTRDYLFDLHGMNPKTHRLFFHSGASEGINTLLKGFAEQVERDGKKLNFFYTVTDHSCLKNLSEDLEVHGHNVTVFSVDENGELDDDEVIRVMNDCEGIKLFNYTWVNNESGVVLDLDRAARIKKETGALVHVDAVQSVGKIDQWEKLDPALDAYTWSAHKFGGLKGCGYSFVSNDFKFRPFVRGGGQQEGLRSGTENVYGIISIKLALEEMQERFDYSELKKAKDIFEKRLKDELGDKVKIAGTGARHRNATTTYFSLKGAKDNTVSLALDMAGIDVSNGSACSSGIIKPSRILTAMGFSKDESISGMRLSFSPFMTSKEANEFADVFLNAIKKFV